MGDSSGWSCWIEGKRTLEIDAPASGAATADATAAGAPSTGTAARGNGDNAVFGDGDDDSERVELVGAGDVKNNCRAGLNPGKVISILLCARLLIGLL